MPYNDAMDVPRFTEEQKEQLRRYFAGLRLADQMERDRVRGQAVNPDHCRSVGDMLWEQIREVQPIHVGDAPEDDEAESKVARAIVAVGADRRARRSA